MESQLPRGVLAWVRHVFLVRLGNHHRIRRIAADDGTAPSAATTEHSVDSLEVLIVFAESAKKRHG